MAENSYRSSIEEAKKDIAQIKAGIEGIGTAISGLNSDVLNKLNKAFQVKSPQELANSIKQVDAATSQLKEKTEFLARETERLQRARQKLTVAYQQGKLEERISVQNAKEAAIANSKMVGAYDKLNLKLKQKGRELRNLIAAEQKNTKEIKRAQREYDKLTKKVNQANAATGNFTKGGLGGAVRGIRNLLGAFGLASGVYIFADMAKQGFQLAKRLDSLNFAMKAIITDTNELARAQSFLADISERYGAGIVSLTERYTKFTAAAKQANVASADIEAIFGSFTKISGVLGLREDELNGVFLALEQMLSKGKVTTEELRRQLGERLPGAFGIMAQTLQVLNPDMEITVQTLDDMLKKGEVLSAEVLPEFARQAELALGTSTIDRVETLNASTTRLSNAWVNLVGGITKDGGAISTALTFIIDGMASLLSGLGPDVVKVARDEFQNMSDAIYNTGKASKVAAEESRKLLKEYESLTKKGVTPTLEEKKRLDEIVLLLTDHLGDSVVSLNEETNALELNTEAVKLQIKAKRLAADAEASTLAGRMMNAKDEIAELQKEKERAERELATRKGLISEEDQRHADAIRNSQSYNAMELPESVEKYNEAQRELTRITKEQAEQEKRRLDLLTKLQSFGYSEETIEGLLGTADAAKKATDGLNEEFGALTVKAALEKNIASEKARYDATDPNDTEARKAILVGIEIMEKNLEIWELNTKAKKEDGKTIKQIKDGSIAYFEAIISGLKDEQSRLEVTTEGWREKQDAIERNEHAIHKLKVGWDALNASLGEGMSKEGEVIDTTGLDKFAQDVMFEERRQAMLEAMKTGEMDMLQSINEQILANSKNLSEEQLDALKEQMAAEEEVLKASYDQRKDIEKAFNDAKLELVEAGIEAIGDRRVKDVEDEIHRNREYYAELLDNEALTEDQRAAIEARREKREVELEKKKRKREKEAFLLKQGFALAEIGLNLAQTLSAITLAAQQIATTLPFPLGGIMSAQHILTNKPEAIATAAISTGMVLAQTIPQLYTGTDNADAGWALVDEKRPEVHTDKYGNIKSMGQDGPNFRMLAKGDKIYPSHEHFFNSFGESEMQKAIWDMNMSSNGEILNNSQVDNSLLASIGRLEKSNAKVWGEVKKLASRPINNNVKVQLEDKRAY